MNAYELSNELENAKSISKIARLVKEQTIPMLRQLQDDLSDLQRHIPDESFDRTASHMAGEYVSYPAKTLTDDEIKELAYQHRWNGDIEFARAILRRAQEK